jgi:hypothetical protein
MTLSLLALLLLAAFVITLVHSVGKAPLWPAVLLLTLAELIALGVSRAIP